jgi:peptide deformylase
MPASKNSTRLLPSDAYDDTPGDTERALIESELGMVAPGTQLLNETAKPVLAHEINAQLVKQIISRLHDTAAGQRRDSRKRKKRRTLVGLAAPQVGVGLRIVLIDTKVDASRKKYGKPECFINPEIVWRSRETEEGREGCFSTGQIWGLVRRPIAVKVRALDEHGKPFERILEGFTARIAQHEIDHLDGIRFPDRITSDAKRHWVHAEELDGYPKHIKHWERLCSRERWEEIKAIPTQ